MPMKALSITLILIFSSPIWALDSIEFYDIYRYDLVSKMSKKLPQGRCIDFKKHFLWSLEWVGKHSGQSDWKHKRRTVIGARSFCKASPHVPVCDSLESFILLKKKSVEDSKREDAFEDFYRIEVAQRVTRKDLVNISYIDKVLKAQKEDSEQRVQVGNCRENTEAVLSMKFYEVITAKFADGDDSLAAKMMYKYDGVLDGGDVRTDLDEMNDLCHYETRAAKKLLLSEYTSSIKNGCLESLRKSGLSLYDNKQVYCSGKTPLACALFKKVPKDRK